MRKHATLGISFILALFISFSLALVSCSSSKKKDEASAGASDISDASTNADAAIDTAAGDQAAPPADGTAAPADPNAAAPAPETAEVDLGGGAPADPNAPPVDPGAVGDTAAQTPPAEEPPKTDETAAGNTDLFGAGTAAENSGAAPAADAAPKKSASLQHIKDAPFEKGGQLLNTVYVARSGDTMKSVSEKLFGEDKSKMLKKANPSLKAKLKAGDKLYFNSPSRPDDRDKMVVAYEDQGLPASVYTSKDGDSLKSLAKEWLGSEEGWKEIYVINRGVASPKELPAGTELRYWPSTVGLMAYNMKKESPEPVAAEEPAPEPDQNQKMAANNAALPPPPPPPPPAAGTTNNNPSVPDVAANNTSAGIGNVAPPAPPPSADDPNMAPKPSMKKAKSPVDAGDKDQMFFMIAAGLGLVGLASLFAIRRARARRQGNVTQV